MEPDLSIVIPVYNSEKSLDELYHRLTRTLRMMNVSYEIIFVNDGSKDNSLEILKIIRNSDKKVKIIDFINNFGQDNAILCGFKYSKGNYVVTLDDDLQHPPEEITKLYNCILRGYKIVMGVPKEKKHSFYRKIGSKLINNLNNIILKKPPHITMSSFRILTRDTIDKILEYKNIYVYLPACMLKSVNSKMIINIEVEHNSRKHGKSMYTHKKLIKLFSKSLINNSAIPLRIGVKFGFFISLSCFVYAMYIIIRKLIVNDILINGWASLAVLITFLFGILFIYLGIIGEYIYRILIETSDEKQYVINSIEIED